MIRMKDFTEDEKIELNDYFDSEIKKAHLNGNWWGDKILEIAERHYKKLIRKVVDKSIRYDFENAELRGMETLRNLIFVEMKRK